MHTTLAGFVEARLSLPSKGSTNNRRHSPFAIAGRRDLRAGRRSRGLRRSPVKDMGCIFGETSRCFCRSISTSSVPGDNFYRSSKRRARSSTPARCSTSARNLGPSSQRRRRFRILPSAFESFVRLVSGQRGTMESVLESHRTRASRWNAPQSLRIGHWKTYRSFQRTKRESIPVSWGRRPFPRSAMIGFTAGHSAFCDVWKRTRVHLSNSHTRTRSILSSLEIVSRTASSFPKKPISLSPFWFPSTVRTTHRLKDGRFSLPRAGFRARVVFRDARLPSTGEPHSFFRDASLHASARGARRSKRAASDLCRRRRTRRDRWTSTPTSSSKPLGALRSRFVSRPFQVQIGRSRVQTTRTVRGFFRNTQRSSKAQTPSHP